MKIAKLVLVGLISFYLFTSVPVLAQAQDITISPTTTPSQSTNEEPALGNLSKSLLPKEVLVETKDDQSFFEKLKGFFKKIWSNPLRVFTRSKAVHQATVPSELAPEGSSDPISGFLGGSQGFYGVNLPKEVGGDNLEESEQSFEKANFPEEIKPITGQ